MPSPPKYQEPWRPQFHYSQPDLFMNDPNGLVHHDGEYHLFYQYRRGIGQGIAWGHAVSRDLLHWENLPVAIPRGADDKNIFSGSVVIDHENTSGFGEPGNSAMVAIYTAAGLGNQSQALAYSLDHGRTFTHYEGNPVLDLGLSQFRDPKVFWHESTKRWVMVVAVSDEHQVAIYGSPDLKQWQRLSTWGPLPPVGGQYEVPDLFPLRVHGDPTRTKWVMVISTNPGGRWGGSLTAAYIGDFDGTTFKEDARYASESGVSDPGAQPDHARTPWLDWGKDNYAGITFDNLPDDRRLLVGWLNNWQYAESTLVPTTEWWRGQQSEPRELALATIDGRAELVQQPLRELEQLHTGPPHREPARKVTGELAIGAAGKQLDIRLRLHPGTATRSGLKVLTGSNGDETVIGYDATAGRVYIDRMRAGTAGDLLTGFTGVHSGPLQLRGDHLDLRILVDHSIVEVFAAGGRRALTDLVYPATDSDGLALFAEGGTAEVRELVVHRMRSIWNRRATG